MQNRKSVFSKLMGTRMTRIERIYADFFWITLGKSVLIRSIRVIRVPISS